MEEENYKKRLKVIKLESRKVKNGIKNFSPEVVTNLHLANFHERLKVIRDKLDVFSEITSQLIVDLDDNNRDEMLRIQNLEKD